MQILVFCIDKNNDYFYKEYKINNYIKKCAKWANIAIFSKFSLQITKAENRKRT